MANPSDRQTLRYYDENADAFIASTINADMSEFYDKFLPYVRPSGCIMDLGCGSGRDSLAFRNRGYRVIPVEPSEVLARKAEDLLNQFPIRRQTAQEINDLEEFDGIWANASLLHLAEEAMADALHRIACALKPDGALFISLKMGEGEGLIDGRFFRFYTPESFRKIIKSVGKLIICELWQSEDVRPDRQQTWLNAILLRIK